MLLTTKPMNIDELFNAITQKNPNIARPTIRGRLSDMVNAGELKKIVDSKNSTAIFKVIHETEEISAPMIS